MDTRTESTETPLDCEKLGLSGICEFVRSESRKAFAPVDAHEHSHALEVIVFYKGIQSVAAGGDEYTVMGGDMLVIPERTQHSTALQPQYRIHLSRLLVDMRARCSILGLDRAHSDRLRESLGRLRSVCYHGAGEANALLSTAYDCLSKPDETERLYGRGMLLAFLCSLESVLSRQVDTWRDKTVIDAMNYINDNITQRLDLSDVAEHVGVSLSYFKAKFREQTGVSPMYYVNWRKIAYAKRLIAHGYSVTDSAMILSFNSSAYFSTVFRNITSRTPLEYRAIVEAEMAKQQHLFTLMLPSRE